VGGGVVGASTAYYLSEEGAAQNTTVIERCSVACAASGKRLLLETSINPCLFCAILWQASMAFLKVAKAYLSGFLHQGFNHW